MAAVINVPGNAGTIQAGIDLSTDGDIILVSEGTYIENINFNGKNVTVRGAGGPTKCIIDGNQAKEVVQIVSSESSSATLEGFTIRNGIGYGGGIRVQHSSPNITNCIITQNTGLNVGGLLITDGDPIIRDCIISNNTSNYADARAAGVEIRNNSSVTMISCRITGNTAPTGAGMYVVGSTTILNAFNCVIDNNFTQSLPSSSGTQGEAGGIYFQADELNLYNCVIANNTSTKWGGGIFTQSDPVHTKLVNTIVWGNSPNQVYLGGASPGPNDITVEHSNIQGGQAGIIVSSSNVTGNPVIWNSGNLNVTPEFVSNTDFALQSNSPLIDAGTNAGSLREVDGGGDKRIHDGENDGNATVDIGAYEFGTISSESVALGLNAEEKIWLWIGHLFGDQWLSTNKLNKINNALSPRGKSLSSIYLESLSPISVVKELSPGSFEVTEFGRSVLKHINDIDTDLGDSNLTGLDLSPSPVANQQVNIGNDLYPNVEVVSFGDVKVGESKIFNLKIENTGDGDLVIERIRIQEILVTSGNTEGGEFSFSLPAGGVELSEHPFNRFSVGAGQSLNFAIAFRPITAGAKSSKFTWNSNGGNRQSIDLTLSGTAIAPDISLSSTSLSFGDVQTGQSASQTLTVSNTGTADLSISGISSSDNQFTLSTNSFTVSAGGTQDVTVNFAPTALTNQSGTLTITSNDIDESSLSVSLSGNGTAPDIHLHQADTNMPPGFDSTEIGQSFSADFSISNLGTADLIVSGISSSNNQFTLSINSFVLVAGGNQIITVTFQPSSAGRQSATITLSSNDPDEGTAVVSVSGYGTAIPNPDISLSTATLSFGDVQVGQSTTQSFTISNRATADGQWTGAQSDRADLTVTGISSGDGQFTLSTSSVTLGSNGPFTISAFDSIKAVTVTFKPSSEGPQSTTITLSSNDPDAALVVVTVSGNGTAQSVPDISLSSTALSFGEVQVGQSSIQTLTITNTGNADLSVTGIGSSDGQFGVSNNSFVVGAGGSQEVTVLRRTTL
jgi:hypothetical protein